jgi:hypothetical protein
LNFATAAIACGRRARRQREAVVRVDVVVRDAGERQVFEFVQHAVLRDAGALRTLRHRLLYGGSDVSFS